MCAARPPGCFDAKFTRSARFLKRKLSIFANCFVETFPLCFSGAQRATRSDPDEEELRERSDELFDEPFLSLLLFS